MEHFFFKFVRCCLVLRVGVSVVEHTLLAGTSRAYVAASVATNATGELILPEGKALVRAQCFKLCDLVESVYLNNISVVAEKLVERHVLL